MQFTATARHPAPSALGGQASAARLAAAQNGGGSGGSGGGRRAASPFVETLMHVIPLVLDLGMRILGPLLVLFAWGLFLCMTYIYFWHILPMRELDPLSFPGCLYTAVGVWILVNLFYNHCSAVFTSPGRVPDAGPPKTIETLLAEEVAAPLVRRTDGVTFVKYCRTCLKPKPERSHHCHICKTCVLKMDHHCPWIANCVGHGNYKFFCLFLVYLWLGCLYLILMSLPCVLFTVPWPIRREHEGPVFFAMILGVSALIALGLMSGLHLYLVLTNQTTIELYGNRRARSDAQRRGEPEWRNPYDLGWRKNFQQVFGVSPFLGAFMLPGKPDVGDGVRFPRVDSATGDAGASA